MNLPFQVGHPALKSDEVEKRLCEKSLYEFMRHGWHVLEPGNPFQEAMHLKALCEHLEAVTDGRIKRLIANICPGFAKSICCGIFWPAWEWIKKPETRWLFVSYSDDFAMRDSSKTRTLIKSEWYQSHWRDNYYVKYNADTKSKFENNKAGFRQSTSIQGGGTGSRADRIVCDDLLKIEEAYSQTERDRVNKWFDEVGSMRGSDPRTSSEVIIHQRLHVDDITGHLLKRGGYVHFFVPLEFDPGHVCETLLWKDPRTAPGDCCWPERFTPDIVAEKKKTLGFYGANAQLQQRPETLEGGIIRKQWFTKFVKHLPKQARRVRAWDLACLVAGTLIETIDGLVPIEKVKVGDLVLTRDGYKEVEWSGITKIVNRVESLKFSNGSTICGTADHKIWDEKLGWTDIDKFGCGSYSLIVSNNGDYLCHREAMRRKSSSLTESDIDVSRVKSISTHGEEIRNLANGLMIPSTGPFGDFITDLFQKAMTFIIKMGTSTITTFQTSNACLGRSTPGDMALLMNGICDPKQRNNGSRPGKSNGTISHSRNIYASFAENHSNQERVAILQSFARNCVAGDLLGLKDLVRQKSEKSVSEEVLLRNAKFVKGYLLAMDIAARSHVETNIGHRRVNVAVNTLGNANKFRNVVVAVAEKSCADIEEGVPVYDLTVKDSHEFFANGILVHNSTAAERSKGKVCYTASVLMSRDVQGCFYIEEVLRGKWDPHERDKVMLATAYLDRKKYGAVTTVVEREGGSSGKDQEQAITKLLYGFEVWFEHPTGPKDTRIMAFASQLGAGNVYFPEDDTPWFPDYVQELVSVPHGDYWDQVDATSAGFNNLSKSSWFAPAIGDIPGSGGRIDEYGGSQRPDSAGWWNGGVLRTGGGLRDMPGGLR